MNAFRGFVVKEFYHIFRDRRTLLILFGMPVIMMALFGFAIRNEIENINIVIVDQANDYVTQEIKNRLVASSYFQAVDQLYSAAEVERAFEYGQIKEAILFEPNFARRLHREGVAHVQLIADATDPNTANQIVAYTSAIIQDYQQSLAVGPGAGVRIVPEVRMRFNPELRSANLFVPGLIALLLMLVSALMTSITITREKELGTMEILLVSPLKPIQIIVGKVLPYMGLSFINVLTILVLARLVFAVPVKGSITLLLLECLLFIVCALALGIFISTKTQSQQTATLISLAGLLLPTVILSGFIFPIASMSVPLQWLSNVVPAKWFLIVLKGIMLKGVGIAYVWQETAILGGMTLFFLAVSVKNFKVRLE